MMHRKYLRKYGLQIYPQTKIGYGLYIGHGIGIIISPSAEIGNNCNLSQFTTIGTNHKKAAIIGDNVYIGPSVCIVEDVNIGNNVSIGAGAVVVKDVPENATVAGVPAKILNYNNPGRYVNNRWERNESKI
jgi:serine O-acetyltransferase